MSTSEFTIYTASAGAGKTYNLVYRVLRLCLAAPGNSAFRSILAITFTNKAAAEMKDRIVKTLQTFSDPGNELEGHSMFLQLRQELGATEEELRHKSEEVLRAILHQYSGFSVSTIDKFTNRLIRTFAQDLKVSGNYEVELDAELILSEAVDTMLSDLQEDSALSEVLIQFLNTQLDEGKSPRAEYRLLEVGYTLFEERAIAPLSSLKKLSSRDFLEIRQKLYTRNAGWEQNLKKIAQSILQIIDDNYIDHSLFSRGSLPRYLSGICDNPSLELPSPTVQKQMVGEADLYPKSKAREAAALIDPVAGKLLERCQSLLHFIIDHAAVYELSRLILRNIFSLAVVAQIEKYLEQIKDESNRLPIGEFNQLISRHLNEQPAAFLYERIGDRYRHYFIDEFQDTSRLQWSNLLPLANNTMAQQGSVMLVGDAKQSIYRWRGGEVEQFMDLHSGKDPGNKIEQAGKQLSLYERTTILLKDNWRSKREVVEFNNLFFARVVEFADKSGLKVSSEEHRLLFKSGIQNVRQGEGGYVSIDILGDPGAEELYIQRQGEAVLQRVKEALEDGYELRDICILSRSKKYNSSLSELLSVNGVDVVSSDSLLLSQSEEVQLIVAFLKLALRPDDQWSRLVFLEWFWSKYQERLEETEGYTFISKQMKKELGGWRGFLQLGWVNFSWLRFRNASLVNKIQMVVRGFGFDVQNDPFLQNFMDQALEFEDGKEEGETEFLRWWDIRGAATAIDMPDGLDAVRLMTIHKAKGLEFPVVIVAFANWLAFREPVPASTWLNLPTDDFFGLPAAKVTLKDMGGLPGLEDYNTIWQKHKEDVALDNLNLLYVAFTRAVDRLHILGNDSYDSAQRVTAYLCYFLDLQEVEGTHWSVGVKVKVKTSASRNTTRHVPKYNSVPWSDRLEVAIDSPKNWQSGESVSTAWGKKVHSILSLINTVEDLGGVLTKMESRGSFRAEEKQTLRSLAQQALQHAGLSKYYQEGLRVLNESEILVPGFTSLRPDRLVQEGDFFHIIEYKTGQPQARHRDQVEAYSTVLQQQSLKVGDRVLVYLNEPLQVEKW
ncbi:MAG TPA: hypothetical protein DIU20_10070 [Cryomorphaceae bacterium]|nr:hypothetical protein [Cryomorphaceae bacterium]